MKKIYLTLFFLSILFNQVFSQTSEDSLNAPKKWRQELNEFGSSYQKYYSTEKSLGVKFGVWGIFDYNLNFANFTELGEDYTACCPEDYGLIGTTGYGLGLIFDYPLDEKMGLVLRAGYRDFSSELTKDEIFPYSFDGVRKEGKIVHTVNTELAGVLVTPMFRYRLFSKFDLLAGIDVGVVMTSTFDQKEELKVDDPYVFTNDSSVRNVRSGDLPGASSALFGISAGMGYEMPLNSDGTFILEPALLLSYGLNSISDNFDWNQGSARLSIALKYSTSPTIDTMSLEDRRIKRLDDSIYIVNRLTAAVSDSTIAALNARREKIEGEIGEEVLIARIAGITYYDKKTNQEKELKNLYVEEQQKKRCVPLLNYVFFDKNSDIIPDRYNSIEASERINFDENKLITSPTIDIYRNILNIIGKRLTENPSAKITLTGCNDNTGTEEDNLDLSRSRAERVSYYLQNVWKIPSSRIIIKSRNLPEHYTQSIDKKGIEENRRVEITSSNPEIIMPVCMEYIYKDVYPKEIFTHLNIKSGSGLSSWYIKMEDYYGKSKKIEMKDKTIPEKIKWDFTNNYSLIPDKKGSFVITLYVQDKNNQSVNATESFEVEYIDISTKRSSSRLDTTKETYSILLPFDEPEPGIIGRFAFDMAKNSIKDNSGKNISVSVTGFTDILGTEQKNMILARQRAEQTIEMLNLPNIEIKSKALSNKYDNSFPEGRFYNRSADIEIFYSTF